MTVKERRILSDMKQRTLFDLTQDGLVIGRKLERIYPAFDTDTFIKDVRTEMEGQTIYNVTKAIGCVLRCHLPENYSEALAILMQYADGEIPAEPSPLPSEELQTSLRPISHFVSLYGLADFDASMNAFCKLAKYRCTRGGEMREFLINHPERCFERFREWGGRRKRQSPSLCVRVNLHPRNMAKVDWTVHSGSAAHVGAAGYAQRTIAIRACASKSRRTCGT